MSSGLKIQEILCGDRLAIFGTVAGPVGSEITLGLTESGSVLRIEKEDAEIVTEEFGISNVKRVHRGERVTVELVLKQFDNAQLKVALPGSTEGTGATVKRFKFGKQAGTDLSTIADQLRLHPITIADLTDKSQDIVIYLAVPEPLPIESRFNNEEAAMVGLRFNALIDDSKADGNLIGHWKDDA